MMRRVLAAGLIGGVWVLASLTGGCVPSDEPASSPTADVSALGIRAEPALPPVALPDLSRLSASAREQVRERYASLQALHTTADANPAPAALANAYGAVGVILMAAEFVDAAAISYLHAQALAPGDPRWPYYLGHLHSMRQDQAQAAAAFERALELRPSDVATLVWLGRTYFDRGQPEVAERLFIHAAALDPSSAGALSGVGRAALARQNFRRATEYLEQALAVEPRASSVHYPLAMAYRALGRVDEAETHLQRRGDGEPTLRDPLMEAVYNLLPSAMVFEGRGVQALRDGRSAEALDAFRQGLDLEPNNPSLRQRLATALAITGDTRGAVEELEETLRRTPDFARAHFSLAAILELSGRHREAARRYVTALEYEPSYVAARMGLAEALRSDGRLEESLSHYAQVVEAEPGFAEAWIGRADALVRLRRYREAHEWLAEARVVHPDRPELSGLDETVEALLQASPDIGR